MNEDIGYAGGVYSSEDFVQDKSGFVAPEMQDFHFTTAPLVRNRRPMLPGFVGGPIQTSQQTYAQTTQLGDTRGIRRGRLQPRGNANSYW